MKENANAKDNKKTIFTLSIILLVLVALILAIYFISGTWAKYASSASASAKVGIANWDMVVEVGDVSTDITKTSTFDLDLTTDSDYVVKNKIAPDTTASGTFTIDPKGAEVAVKYTVELGNVAYSGSASGVTFSISKVTVGGNDVTSSFKATEGGSYSNTITLSDRAALTSTDAVDVKVEVTWTSAGDTTDTAYGIEAGTLTVPVTVTAEQYSGT